MTQSTLWEPPQAPPVPPPTRTKGMTYEEALNVSEGGSRVRRDTWTPGAQAYRESGRWYLALPGKEPRRWTPTLCDQGARNWEIIPKEVQAA